MKIDASRYTMFWSNPERYRLREIWKLAPIEPKPGTFASLLTYGRQRGTAFHELLDARYRGVPEMQAVQELIDGGFDDKVLAAVRRMYERVVELYADEQYLAHEVLFEYPIPDSPHSMVGRIDGILKDDEGFYISDWKTSTGYCTKGEMQEKAEEYCRSAQVSFYLLGAGTLGFDTRRFLYRLVYEHKKRGVQIPEYWTTRTSLELKAFARGVHQTCELIQWMKDTFGVEKPWPQVPERYPRGYDSIAGRPVYQDYTPEGFEPKKEHLELMEDYEADAS